MSFFSEIDASTGLIQDVLKTKGLDLQGTYLTGIPFPHIAIDDFLPVAVLDKCLAEFPESTQAVSSYNRDQEKNKRSYNPDGLTSFSRHLFHTFNSRPFIQVLENICGIKGLIPDPYFLGGGFHEISQGGHLSVHADFNHHIPLNLERRINVLIYLNRGWREEYGGMLELWDAPMQHLVRSFVPTFNRCVIFNTTADSNHGNPQPVVHPNNLPRRSIALYYYTATWDASKRTHTTQFKMRPGSTDRADRAVRAREFLSDFLPPILYRNLIRFRKFRR